MSDTPRTDDVIMQAVAQGMRLAPVAECCRELERENAALREALQNCAISASGQNWQQIAWIVEGALYRPKGGAAVSTILAPDHRGMRVNGSRYLQQAHGTGFTFMRREMARHLEEMGRRYYAGDVAAVDEFLQLYCIAESERAAVVAERAKQKEAQP